MGVLELVGLDILPQSLDDHWTGLSVNPQETSQAGIQFELGRLKQTAQKGEMAADTAMTPYTPCAVTPDTLPGNPASEGQYSAHLHLLASSPGSHPSPEL